MRYRALIGLMVYFFARIGVALGRMVNHVYTQNRLPLGAAAGKRRERHSMSYGHNFDKYLTTYLN